MGLLRLIFALSVVVIHTYPLWGFQGLSTLAVDSFFVISGFYMSLILTEKYIKKNGSYKLFVITRFLRIYPLYWLILLLAFAFSMYKFVFFPEQESYIRILLDFLSHSPHFGFEVTMTAWRNISLIFTPDYFLHNFTSPGYLLIQPAWTLQVELLFYLIAPFIVKIKMPILIVLTIIFSIITFGYVGQVSPSDSSLTFIFITRFVYFLFGILSYRLYTVIKKRKPAQKISPGIVLILPIFVILFGDYFLQTLRNGLLIQIILFCYYLILLVCIALIFLYSKNKTFDRTLGELSYPVYLSHQLIFKVINGTPLGKQNHELITLSCIFVTLIVSLILIKTIENPIDKIRHKMLH